MQSRRQDLSNFLQKDVEKMYKNCRKKQRNAFAFCIWKGSTPVL